MTALEADTSFPSFLPRQIGRLSSPHNVWPPTIIRTVRAQRAVTEARYSLDANISILLDRQVMAMIAKAGRWRLEHYIERSVADFQERPIQLISANPPAWIQSVPKPSSQSPIVSSGVFGVDNR